MCFTNTNDVKMGESLGSSKGGDGNSTAHPPISCLTVYYLSQSQCNRMTFKCMYILCVVTHNTVSFWGSHLHEWEFFPACSAHRGCLCVWVCAGPCPWGLLFWFNSAPHGRTQSDTSNSVKGDVQWSWIYTTAAPLRKDGLLLRQCLHVKTQQEPDF